MKKAIVLLSGGLDSATTLAIAASNKYDCYALSFNYCQRHEMELAAAASIASLFDLKEHKIFEIDLGQIGGSALTDFNINVPDVPTDGIPVTYVPARNTIFLAIALAYAETLTCSDIFFGVNVVDYSGYPDCRPEYVKSFIRLANLATKAGIENENIMIHTPLINLTKSEIIRIGMELDVDYSLTISCYQPDTSGKACGMCDSCRFRKKGFEEAGYPDPTKYR